MIFPSAHPNSPISDPVNALTASCEPRQGRLCREKGKSLHQAAWSGSSRSKELHAFKDYQMAELPKRKKGKNADDKNATKDKQKRYWKAARIAAAFGIIEALSLVLWIKAEDFDQKASHHIRWVAACGILAGGVFLAHKLACGKSRKSFIRCVWVAWALICLILPFLKSPSSTDESGNPEVDPKNWTTG